MYLYRKIIKRILQEFNCKGVSLNVKTTLKSRRKGAEQMFPDFLEQYQVPWDTYPLIELQLKKLFGHFNADSTNDEKRLPSQLTTLLNQIKQLKVQLGHCFRFTFKFFSID